MKKNLFFLFLLHSVSLFSQTNCTSFNVNQFVLNGNASVNNTNEVTLTLDQYGLYGTMWSQQKILFNQDFTIEYEFNFGTKNGAGADGIAFVLQPLSSTAGGIGGGIGYQDISPAFAIEFDTYYNPWDPMGNDHIALIKNGQTNSLSAHNDFIPPIDIGNVEDGNWHPIKIEWTATSKTLKLTFDGRVIFNNTIDLNAIFPNLNSVYWGFTASTGGSNNIQKVKVTNYCVSLENCSNIPEITASATEVCIGDQINLKINNSSQSLSQFQIANPDLILFKTIGSHSYFYKNQVTTWPEAKTHGDQIGASMYIINDANEELLIYNALPSRGNDGIQYWIGLYQDLSSSNYFEPSGGWKWVDNSPLQYSNWYTGEPNNTENSENFGQIEWNVFGMKWNDAGDPSNNSCRCTTAFPIYEIENLATYSYLWSTGETTATINPTPTANTTYWCDVTTNGVTCRKEITIIVTTVATPTGLSTQSFCSSATIADLVTSGTSIKWYDTATGGNLIPSTTPLVNGNTYYASSTSNNCESTTRLAVTVNSINVPEITASANTVCSGTAVSLTAGTTTIPFGNTCTLPTNLQTGLVGYWPFCGNTNDTSGNNNDGTVNGATLTSDRFGNVDSAYSFDGVNDFIETNRTHLNSFTASVWIKLNISNCFSAILDAYPSSWEFLSDCVSGTNLSTAIWNNSTTYQIYQSNYIIPQNKWINVVMTYGNNILKIYSEGNLVYTGSTIAPPAINGLLYFGRSRSGTEQFFNGKLDDVAIWDKILTPLEIKQLYTPEISYLWSTGETTSSINPKPLVTTTYWVDVTTNGGTCRKSIIITVKNTPAPTGAVKQQFCNDTSIAALAANGTAVNWYASSTATTALNNTTALANGTTYFATQTIDGCESTNRFQTTVSIQKVPTPTGDGVQKYCLEGNPIVSNLIATGNSILWFDALTNGMPINKTTLLQDNTSYYATTLDAATGCESLQRLAVKVDLFKCNITAYNLITINGNSLNDQLTFEDISYFPDNSVKIYNRYGKLVWETTGYDNTNNAFKGKANVSGVYMKDSFLPAGTYFFIIVYNNTYLNKQTELTGYLQIDNLN
jgi:hypothetical protein